MNLISHASVPIVSRTGGDSNRRSAVEFKQKRFSWPEGVKGLFTAGLPEVDFVGVEVGKIFEPVVVSDDRALWLDSPTLDNIKL